MTGFGVLLIILGVGSLLLPMFNVQFRLMEFVDPYQPWAGILVAVIGAALVAFGLQRTRTVTVSTERTTAAPPPSAAATAPTTSGATAPPEAPAPIAPAGQAVPPPVDSSVPDAPRPTADPADAASDTNRDQP
jgi:hypothetical protein